MNAFQAIILVCLATIPPDRCTEQTALSVMSKRVANELACASGWQDVIARSADAAEVGKDVYVRTVSDGCPPVSRHYRRRSHSASQADRRKRRSWGGMMQVWSLAALVALGAACALPARAEGDAAAGKAVFSKCGVCHSAKEGENKIGPSLYGIVGRPSHSISSYSYSQAMSAYNVTWDAPTLDHYLADPRAVVTGTKMIFPGLKSDTDRANLIAYLATLK